MGDGMNGKSILRAPVLMEPGFSKFVQGRLAVVADAKSGDLFARDWRLDGLKTNPDGSVEARDPRVDMLEREVAKAKATVEILRERVEVLERERPSPLAVQPIGILEPARDGHPTRVIDFAKVFGDK